MSHLYISTQAIASDGPHSKAFSMPARFMGHVSVQPDGTPEDGALFAVLTGDDGVLKKHVVVLRHGGNLEDATLESVGNQVRVNNCDGDVVIHINGMVK